MHAAVLVVGLSVVQPRRPQAGGLIALAGGMLLAEDLGWLVVPRLVAGSSHLEATWAVIPLLSSLWSVAAWAALLVAVVGLVKPPGGGAGTPPGGA